MMNPNSVATAIIALGTNLGNRIHNLQQAARAMGSTRRLEIYKRSAIYETEPVGGPPNQSNFYNACVALKTPMPPHELHTTLQSVENQMGRERTLRWGPRLIDLDLLLYSDLSFSDESLTVPHPRLHERRFVLQPLSDIAPDWIHPVLHRPIAVLLSELPNTGEHIERIASEDWLTL